MRRISFLALLGCLPLVAACSQGQSSSTVPSAAQVSGGVAVIDLDEVARRLGREVSIKQSLSAHEASLNQQLETMRVSYANQITQRKQELPQEPADDELKQLQALEQKALVQIQQARQQAQSNLDGQKRELINSFRDEVKPFASQIAAEKGLSLVVSRNESFLFAFDSAVDITQEVVVRMQQQGADSSQPQPPSVGENTQAQTGSPARLGTNDQGSPGSDSIYSHSTEPGLLPASPQRPIRGE